MDMDDNHFANDFSDEGCLDLAMLPPRENADAQSDQYSNSFDDMNQGHVHHLLLIMHLQNSDCSTNISGRNHDSSTARNSQQPPIRK